LQEDLNKIIAKQKELLGDGKNSEGVNKKLVLYGIDCLENVNLILKNFDKISIEFTTEQLAKLSAVKDCDPNVKSFCENLLEKYRYTNEIFVIGGVNFQSKKKKNSSYYFTRYGHTWGWATWRRAWENYDYNLQEIEEPKYLRKVNEQFETDLERSFFTSIFDLCKDTNSMKSKGIDAWDYQWVVTQIYNSAINITPSVNLIQNIGFDKKATHTKAKIKGISFRKTTGIKKIIHPKNLNIDKDADYYTFYKTNLIYNWSELNKKKRFSFLMKIKNFTFYGLKKIIKKLAP
jgi:hypothetical protein